MDVGAVSDAVQHRAESISTFFQHSHITCIIRASPRLGMTELMTALKSGNLGIDAIRSAEVMLSMGRLQ
jgi:hypothetical protein